MLQEISLIFKFWCNFLIFSKTRELELNFYSSSYLRNLRKHNRNNRRSTCSNLNKQQSTCSNLNNNCSNNNSRRTNLCLEDP